MQVTIKPSKLRGTVEIPGSKSQTHRMIFCAALCEGTSIIDNVTLSEDIRSTINCAEALGAEVSLSGDRLTITGFAHTPSRRFDCGESGATLRFAIPCALAVCGGGEFTGQGRLMERPLDTYFKLFDQMGIKYKMDGTLSLEGKLCGGELTVSGDISSQFVSGLLLALPLMGGGRVKVIRPFRSADYVEMTCDAMWAAGVKVTRAGDSFAAKGEYRPFQWEIERDWSQAAFWVAANSLGAEVMLPGMNEYSRQPDRKILELRELLARDGDIELDMSQNPDLLPPLAVMAAVRRGECRLYGAKHLRYKESDRLGAVTEILTELGAQIKELPEELHITGKETLVGGRVNSHNDHRMAMMAAIAATVCENEVIIEGAQCVNKSYPQFFNDYIRLGGGSCAVISGD